MLAKEIFIKLIKYLKGLYSKQNKNKPRVDFKYLLYYILLLIVCVDNYYKIY